MKKTKWEMYCDGAFYHMWAVRDSADKSFDSPRLFHFSSKADAEAFLKLAEKAHVSVAA